MANPQHLDKLYEGVHAWNQWRRENPKIRPNLREADLSRTDLAGADMAGAHLGEVNFFNTNLNGADLSEAILIGANFTEADLNGADLAGAWVARAMFVNVDLRGVTGLNAVVHSGPSTIDIETLYKSNGEIPGSFLRGCGVPEPLITYIPSLVAAQAGIEYHSLIISYATEDHDFAERLSAELESNGYHCWFKPHNVHTDEWMNEHLDHAIQMRDRVLLILSKNSMNSHWIENEIQEAHRRSIDEDRRILCPVGICSLDELADWEQIDPVTGRDYAHDVREYFIPNFSNWPDHYTYRQVFNEFLRDLKQSSAPLPLPSALNTQMEQEVA